MVTVADLIARLQQLPLDMPIVTPGFDESGYEDASLSRCCLRRLAKVTSYSGQYEESGRYEDHHYSGPPFEAVVINFGG